MKEPARLYQEYLREIAPLGYARYYAKCGDFFRAQRALEQTLAEGYQTWESFRWAYGRDADASVKLLDRIMRRTPPQFATDEPSLDPESSFTRSPKLRSIEEATGIIRTFPEHVQVMLVLSYVEEVPDETIRQWLGANEEALQAVREQLDEKLAGWKPAALGDESPKQFFERAMRQYRLSPNFCESIAGRVKVRTMPSYAVLGKFGWSVLGAVPVVIFLFVSSSHRHWGHQDDEYIYYMLSFGLFGGGGGIWFDVLLWTSAFLLRRLYIHHTPKSMLRVDVRNRILSFLLGCVVVGGSLLAIQLIGTIAPGEIYTRPNAWQILMILRTIWVVGTIIVVSISIYLLAVFAVKRLATINVKK